MLRPDDEETGVEEAEKASLDFPLMIDEEWMMLGSLDDDEPCGRWQMDSDECPGD
jgi:hypothetical protein